MPKKRWEDEAKDRFLRFLRERYDQRYTATGEDVVVNPSTRQNFDYELRPDRQDLPVIALEIFRIVGDEQDIGHHFTWTDITRRLRDELTARGVAGYLIRTPRFVVPKFRRNEFVSEAAQRLAIAIANEPSLHEMTVDGYVVYRLPGETTLEFSYIGGARAINPFGSVSAALDNLLPTKNEQLNVQGRLRTLLILNANMFGQEYDIRRYFSTKDPERFPNLDRVFFEIAPGTVALVFDRRAFDRYREGELPDDEELTGLLLSFVEHRLSSDHKKAFDILKLICEKYGNLNRLSIDGKDALISCGEMFVEEGEWGSVLWIVENLKDDADPPFPNPMHDRLAQGTNSLIIASVRGRLCWLMQKIIVHNLIEHYPYVLNILEGYASGQDFYIRSQSCVPLSEMAVQRRSSLPDGRQFMPEGIAQRIKDIAFRMLRDAGTNPALLDDVSSVLQWIRDLTVEEATEVLERLVAVDKLNGVHNRCALLLYFALSRENQFPDLPPFDCTNFKERMHEELRNGRSEFRASLMWQMAGGAEEGTFAFEVIWPFVPSFVSGAYDHSGFLHLRRICEVYVKDHRESVCPIILEALEKLAAYIAVEPGSRGWNVYDLEELFDLLTENCHEDCVIDSVELMLTHRTRIPHISAPRLAAILGQYQSARATDLRARYGPVLNG